jgi:hypothetical protein
MPLTEFFGLSEDEPRPPKKKNVAKPKPVKPKPTLPVVTCPFCKATGPVLRRSYFSTGRVIVAVALLFICFPIFWVPLLEKEYENLCGSCRTKLG